MAKGQKRSNREKKKPKANKPKEAAPASSSPGTNMAKWKSEQNRTVKKGA